MRTTWMAFAAVAAVWFAPTAEGADYVWVNGAILAEQITVWGPSGGGIGVWGQDGTVYTPHNAYCSVGVLGQSSLGCGVYGHSANGPGVQGESISGDGLYGLAWSADKSGVYAVHDNASGYAGYFRGRVHVTGQLSKGGGGFKIDHPLDPENRYLYHSFVESPDMMNVYNGNVVLDRHGEAWVELADWFEALNRDFRYQLTCIGGFAPVYVAEKISGNRFRIAGGTPGLEVSWQVTGTRKDPWAEAHRVAVEEPKPDVESGTYLHPREWGLHLDKDVEWVHRPDVMQSLQRSN